MDKLLLIVVLLHLSGFTFSQSSTIILNNPVNTPVSPEAAKINRSVSYPVSYSTGVANISIPLYEIKVGDITVPITLSYHSSGLRPSEGNGKIATGWTLDAEPSITRTINGLPDEAGGAQTSTPVYPIGYWYNNSKWLKKKLNIALYNKYVIDGKIDEEPDMFTYNLGNQSGTFFSSGGVKYDNESTNLTYRAFVTQPHNDLDIKGVPHSMTIEDGDGIIYEFEKGEKTNGYVTRLLCTMISSRKTAATVNFQYATERRINLQKDNDAVIIEDSYINTTQTPNVTSISNGITRNYKLRSSGQLEISEPSAIFQTGVSEGSIEAPSLSSITFDNGIIQIIGTASRTSSMEIKDRSGNLVKRIDFHVSLYNHNTDLYKLDSVRISFPEGITETYRFDYYSILNVPSSATRALDYWGFFNGEVVQDEKINSLVPSFRTQVKNSLSNIEFEHKGRSRESNPENTQAGMLFRIINPMGVETRLSYGGNKTGILDYHNAESVSPKEGSWYWIDNSNNGTPYIHASINIGGLRVEKIIETDTKTGEHNSYIYDYGCLVNNGQYRIKGWGIVKRHINSNLFCITQEVEREEHVSSCIARLRKWFSSPVVPITFKGGSPVVYTSVIEYKIGKNVNFKTEYKYTSPPISVWDGAVKVQNGSVVNLETYSDRTDKETIYPYDYHEMNDVPQFYKYINDYTYGLLKEKKEYDNDRVVIKTEYKYDDMKKYWDVGIDFKTLYRYKEYHGIASSPLEVAYNEKFGNCDGNSAGTISATNNVITHERQVEYFINGDSLEVVKNYYYSDNDQKSILPRCIETNISNGKVLKEYFTYGKHYSLDYYPESLGNAPASTLLEYKRIIGNDTIYQRQKFVTDGNARVHPEIIKTKNKGSQFYTELNYKYDDYGNVKELKGRNSIPSVYIWSYNNQYIIAKIDNVDSELVDEYLNANNQSRRVIGEMSQPAEVIFDILARIQSVYIGTQVSLYKHKSMVGVQSIITPQRVNNSFEYDGKGRLTEKSIYQGENKIVLENYKYNERR